MKTAPRKSVVNDFSQTAAYLATAESVLSDDHPWIAKARKAREEILSAIADPAERGTDKLRQKAKRQFETLKKEYIQIYMSLHVKARLGVNDDSRRKALLADDRLKTLNSLQIIDMLHPQQLVDFRGRLDRLKSCTSLTEKDMDAASSCPHPKCGFKPAVEPVGQSAVTQLNSMDAELDALLESWTQTLLTNLKDPTTQRHLDLLGSRRKPVDEFIEKEALPDKLDNEFIQTVKEVLAGLEKVIVETAVLKAALLSGGSPVKPDEMKKRFGEFVDGLVKGKEPGKVRIVLE